MMKKVFGIIVIVFLQFNIIVAQNSFEIEGVYALTSEKIISKTSTDVFSSQMYSSFGINGKKICDNVFIQGGIHLKNFGTKVGVEDVIVDDMPEIIGGQSLDIPINFGYYFLNQEKIRLGISLGMNGGFLLNQYHDYYGVIIETIPVYNQYLLHLNSSIELGVNLTEYIILNVRPVFQRQINSNFSGYKQNGIGCQLGISYNFTKK